MPPALCCWCFDNEDDNHRTGAGIAALISWVIAFLTLLLAYRDLVEYGRYYDIEGGGGISDGFLAYIILQMFVAVAYIVCIILLIMGIRNENRWLVLPYSILSPISVIIFCIGNIALPRLQNELQKNYLFLTVFTMVIVVALWLAVVTGLYFIHLGISAATRREELQSLLYSKNRIRYETIVKSKSVTPQMVSQSNAA